MKDEFVVKKLSKMICYHTSEWGLDYNSLQSEIETLLDEGIKKEKNADKKNKLNQKKELTLSNTKKKVEDLQFWSKVKVAIPNTISKISADYIFGPIRYQSRKRFFGEPNLGNNQEEEEEKEKEHTPFPISPKVYHFHPIAFVEQMKRILDNIWDPEDYFHNKFLPTLYKHEGGYQNKASDTGNYANGKLIGPNHGISAPLLKSYLGRMPTVEEMKNLTKDTATDIYKKNF